MAKSRIDRVLDKFPKVNFLYLDLIKYRDTSNKIAEHFSVEHQSPQILIINKKGECIYNCSHSSISEFAIAEAIQLRS
jgi:bacillithiol system protein YtxJ